jgi:hypothetical protein
MRQYHTILAALAAAGVLFGCGDLGHYVPPSHTTQRNLERIQLALMMYRDDFGSLPSTLEQLKPYVGGGSGEDEFEDAWGNRFTFTVDAGGGTARVISYGSDGVAGGAGTAGDLEVSVLEDAAGDIQNRPD